MIGIPVSYFQRKNRIYLLLACASVCLALAILQSEFLWLKPPLDEIGRTLYKSAFFVVLPFRVLVAFVLPRIDHHWSLLHHLISTLGAPFFYYAVFRVAKRLVGYFRAKKLRVERPLDSLFDRRQFLARSAAGSFGIAVGGVAGYSAIVEPGELAIRNYEIPIRDLPDRFDGFRIVQISDTHYGPYTSASFIRKVLDRANELSPDLFVLTGDYVHFTPRAIPLGTELFKMLKCNLGAVAVLGNHDHWEGANACKEGLHKAGVQTIDNSRVFLSAAGLSDAPLDRDSLCIAGLGDLWEDRVSFDEALRDVPRSTPCIVLSHNPDAAELVRKNDRVDLMLSGHTHGGQIRLPRIGAPIAPSQFGKKYLGGMCHGPNCPVVVSRGIGLAGIPLRFQVPPELVQISLRQV
jgi:predicted MPP superfamily phosphohydrolase